MEAQTHQLSANVQKVSTCSGDVATVEVINVTGTAVVWFTVDGVAPTAGGANCIPVAAVAGASRKVSAPTSSGATSVKLVSTGAPQVTVLCDA